MTKHDLCPCGSKQSYATCCGIFHGGELAPDPVKLMRSRYVAFIDDNLSYLKSTWHPETLPEDLDQEEPSNWVKLEIISSDVDEEDDEAEVEFKAYLIHNKKLELLHEKSFFERIDGKWLYHSGEFLNEHVGGKKIKGSDPCPCDSGKIFKNCHG